MVNVWLVNVILIISVRGKIEKLGVGNCLLHILVQNVLITIE